MPQFDPSTFASQIFWLAVTFVLLYLLLSRVALPRIAEVLEERSERIADDLERAAAFRKESDAVVETYQQALAKARSEAALVMAEAGQEMSALAAKRQAEFSQRLAADTKAAEERIARAKDEAAARVQEIAVEVVRDIAAKLTGREPALPTVERSVAAVMKERA
jgi:F-type H+-transporting ATPase subunit b